LRFKVMVNQNIIVKQIKRQKKYLLAAVLVITVIAVATVSYIAWVRPAQKETRKETQKETQIVKYPSGLQELVQMAKIKINKQKNGPGYTPIFYNNYVVIIYDPQYKGYPSDKPYESFVVIDRTENEKQKVKGIVEDFFKGLGVQDLSTLKIAWIKQPVLPLR